MSKEFTKDNYTIIISNDYNFKIYNSVTKKQFVAKKDIDDFKFFSSFGVNFFEICEKFFILNKFKIYEEDDKLILSLFFGDTEISIEC